MTPSPRSRRAVKVLVVLLLVPVLGAVAVYFWVQSLADRRWAEAEGRIRRLSIEYPPPPSRPQAEAMSEPAKEIQIHFVAAIREAARKRDLEPQARALLGRRKSGPDYDRLLGEAQDCLDRLHAGAREYAARPSEFPRGWGADWDPPTLAFLIYSSVLRSRRLRGDGAIFEAAQTNLDALHLVRFWASSGQ
ncbi:MAG: hypothetical protein HY293_11575 [Planctomycetes bacterium]|nr:hypothetical protein [Planctomycetota bacterium]